MKSALVCILFGLLFAHNVSAATTWKALSQAWIYPGAPACNAATEYKDGRKIHTLKPEYFTVTTSGDLQMLTVDNTGCNAYSAANVADIKKYSTEQFVTVSGGGNPLVVSAAKRAAAVTTLTSFAVSSGFTGVELDFEGYGQWTAAQYQGYIAFVTALGTALRAAGKKLMIDGPAIFSTQSQAWYKWKYEDFQNLPVDYLLIMAYDYQYDYACGAAVAPNDWVTSIISWTKGKISDVDRIVMGIPSYGYSGTAGTFDLTIKTKAQTAAMAKYASAARSSASYEMTFTNGQTVSFYQDTAGLNSKRALIESLGVKRVSVWHLGGNDWFSGTEPTTTSASTPAPSTTTTTTTNKVGTGTSSSGASTCVCQTQRQVDAQGNVFEVAVPVQGEAVSDQSAVTVTASKLSSRDIFIISAISAIVGISGMIVGTIVGFKLHARNAQGQAQNRFSARDDSDDDLLEDHSPLTARGVNKRRGTEAHMDTPDMSVDLRRATLTKETTRLAPSLTAVPLSDSMDK